MSIAHCFQWLSLLGLFIFTSISSYAQTELDDLGDLEYIFVDAILNVWEGEYQDFKIPDDPFLDYIRFTLRGGDGGTATVGNTSAYGGDGAVVEFSVKIGTGEGEIPAGEILRFMIGKRGQDHSVNALDVAISGGGGGTGIILKDNSNDFAIPLAIAGGGGGAKRRPSGGSNGQGGRASEDGGDGEGSRGGSGGADGFPDPNYFGTGGSGGAFYNFTLDINVEDGENGIYGTEGVGGTTSNGGNGGYGCGGGGAADATISRRGAGGGGGYSSGGGSGCNSNTCGAGGGGSYLNPSYTFNGTKTAGGATSPASYGQVSYQFYCYSAFKGAPTVLEDVFCYGAEKIQLDGSFYNTAYCEQENVSLSYRRVDNNEVNSTGIFSDLQSGQSYDFELLVDNELADTYTYTVGSEIDDESPIISCVTNTTLDLEVVANPSLTIDDFLTMASDNCGIATRTIEGHGNSVSFSCDDIGDNTFTIRVTDLVGNSSSCNVNVSVLATLPTGLAVMPISLDLDSNGEATLSDEDLDVFSSGPETCFSTEQIRDNYSVPAEYQNLDCGDVGINYVVLDNANGILDDITLTLTVNDPIPITASVADVTLILDETGIATLATSDLEFTVNDNCFTDQEIIDVYSLPTENTTFDCTDIGTSIIFLDRTDSDFPAVSLSITVESSDFGLPAITTDFCTDRTFDLTSLEEDITTASGTFSYTQQIERLYVPNWDAGTINVIDLNTNNILTTITVGEEPYGVQVSPDHLKVYVANYRDNTVSVIDVVSNTVEATITGGFNRPWSIAFNSDGSRAYVSNREGDNVIVINTSTNSIIESAITVGDAPEAVIVSPDDAKVYVANYDTDNVTVINTSDNSTSTISIENNPRDLALSADGSQLYVCNRSGSISVIDIATDMVEQHVATETQTPEAFTVIPTGNIYTVHGSRENGAINVLESGSPFQVSKTLIDPDNINFFEGICANDDGSIIFLVDRLKDLIHLFNTNTNTEISTIQLAGLSLIVGDFYAKTTITLTDPTAFSPLLGDVINVAFDGGEECAATTTITFDEGYTQIAQLEITAIITSDSLFNSADTILTTGTVEIEANDTIIFEAADLILLQQGFHAKANSAFQARILPSACGDATQNIQSEVESRSQEVATNETTVQIVQDNDMQLIASPNPLRAFTQLEFYIPKEGAIHIYLSNMQGQMVYEQHFSNLAVGWQQTQISVPHLPDGMYFLQLRSTEQQVVKQLVIQQ